MKKFASVCTGTLFGIVVFMALFVLRLDICIYVLWSGVSIGIGCAISNFVYDGLRKDERRARRNINAKS